MITLPDDFIPEDYQATVYHYCSLSTFMKIVEGKSLWLTSIDKMNDYAEGNWLTHIVSELCSEKLAAKVGERDLFNNLIKKIPEYIESRLPYMSCFSEQEDLLSQWRGYAEGGRGVAIGFKTRALKQRMQPFFGEELPTNPGYCNGLAKVHYPDKDKLRNWLSPVLDRLAVPQNCVDVGKGLSNYALLFKNPAFKEEGEWRIVATPQRKFVCGWSIKDPNLSGALKFRHTEKGLSSYFQLPIQSTDITKVVLGPLNQSESIDVRAFLCARLGGRIRVSRSTATYSG